MMMQLGLNQFLKSATFGLAILAGSSGAFAADTYQAGVEAAFPPWSYVENGEFKGIAIDAAREIAKEEGFTLEFKDLPWPSLIPALAANKIDVLVTGMFVTKERNKVIDYTIPWYESNDVVVVPKESVKTIASALCCEARVGTQAGSDWENWINANLLEGPTPTGVTLQTYEDPIAAVEDLKIGRIDSVIVSPDVADDLIAKGRDIKVVGTISTQRPWAIAVGKGDPKMLLAKLNRGMVKLYKSGKWAEIVHAYLPTASIPKIPGNMPSDFESYAQTPPGLE